MTTTRNIAILGSTGSIGRSALQVLEGSEQWRLVAISGHDNLPLLIEQARVWRPEIVVLTNPEQARRYTLPELPGTEFRIGAEHLLEVAKAPQVDTVLAAIVGMAGLESTLAAAGAGKRIALANKESLVVGGHLIEAALARSGGQLIPVDSEHSAIFQALQCGRREEVARVILTASGGPFRETPAQELESVTLEQALAHPTWDMGQKISIDSASMMNKALEIIEAKWLFDLGESQLDLVVHPQSMVHSLVEFVDGSVIAQVSPPDMKLPIQYAFSYPQRIPGRSPRLDLTAPAEWTFLPPDRQRFPAIDLGFEVVRMGGTCGAVLNAANEAAVTAFIEQQIRFTDIAVACREILENHHFDPHPDLPQLLQVDRWARQEIAKWTKV